jgi:hypothetical protein
MVGVAEKPGQTPRLKVRRRRDAIATLDVIRTAASVGHPTAQKASSPSAPAALLLTFARLDATEKPGSDPTLESATK